MQTVIASRYWSKNCPMFYVSDAKGRRGDWGYTTDPKKALPLTPGQAQRFAADCRHVGVTAQFRPCDEPAIDWQALQALSAA